MGHEQNRRKLQDLAASYCKMPNRGACLTVSNGGIIGNGYVMVAFFASKRMAETMLHLAGFCKIGNYWKLI